MATIVNELESVEEFGNELQNNPGVIIIKFSATWCGPCKKIENQVKGNLSKLSNKFKCFIIDIDEFLEIYAFFKTKRMVGGIPSMLAWKRGNSSNIPDEMISSSNPAEVDAFFQRCLALV